jgi:hypothetical protein
MTPFSKVIARSALSNGSHALAALVGVALLASPLTPVLAAPTEIAPMRLAQAATTPAAPTDTRVDTVEQRIASLHTSLKITPEQEPKWAPVAQAMRDNAVAMEKMVAEGKATPMNTLSAVDDLKRYQKFAQAHVDGLKNILSAFESLYSAMPADQKKIADGVFESSGHRTDGAHG